MSLTLVRLYQPDEVPQQAAGGAISEDYAARLINIRNWQTAFGGSSPPPPDFIPDEDYLPPQMIRWSTPFNVSQPWMGASDEVVLTAAVVDDESPLPPAAPWENGYTVPLPNSFDDGQDAAFGNIMLEFGELVPTVSWPVGRAVPSPWMNDPAEMPPAPPQVVDEDYLLPVQPRATIWNVLPLWLQNQDEQVQLPIAFDEDYLDVRYAWPQLAYVSTPVWLTDPSEMAFPTRVLILRAVAVGKQYYHVRMVP